MHQISTNVAILFQTTDDGQAVLASNYPENCQISDSTKGEKKFQTSVGEPNEN